MSYYKNLLYLLFITMAFILNGCGSASDSNDTNRENQQISENGTSEQTTSSEEVKREYAVFKTGETRSIFPGDDGATQRGTAHSYKRSQGIVTDTLTHLQWQDSNIKSQTWNDANDYCKELIIQGVSDWRLPTVQELQSLVNLAYTPKIDPSFATKSSGKYWTSTEYPYAPETMAYYINFSNGFSANYGDRSVYDKSNRYYVRCVRGDRLPNGNFTKVTGKEVVIDTTTKLMWEDTSHIEKRLSVEEAIGYCESLTLGGYSDWHLPNFNEIFIIADRSKYDPAVNSIFVHKLSIGDENRNNHYRAANYWTSTYYGSSSSDPNIKYYRTFNERDGASHRCRYYMGMHVRCVRKID